MRSPGCIAGEFTFKIGDEVTAGGPGTCAFMPRNVPHAWKNTGSETGRVLFLYTPAAAGGLIEALSSTARPTPRNTTNSSSATAGKSSAQTRFERASWQDKRRHLIERPSSAYTGR